MFLVQKYVRISRPPGASGLCPLTGARVPLTHPERPGCAMWGLLSVPRRGRASCSMAGHIKTPGRTAFCAAVRPGWCVGCTTRPAVHQGGKCDGNMVGGNNTTCGKMVHRHFTISLYYGFRGLLSRFFLRVCGLPAGADQAARRLLPEMSNDIADDHIHQNDGKNAFHFLPPPACKAQNL